MKVEVIGGDIAKALRALKYKLQRGGTFKEEKRCRYYLKPSEERRRRIKEAKKRAWKDRAKRAIRDGAVPAPKPKPKPKVVTR